MNPATEDRLDPQLKRDLFFADLALTRRQLRNNLIAVVVAACGFVGCVYAGGEWRRFVFLNGLIPWWFALQGARQMANRRRAAEEVPPEEPRRFRFDSVKSLIGGLDTTRASAAKDADLASDPRLAAEATKIQSVRRLANAALVAQVVLLIALVVATVVEIKDTHFWATEPTIEFVDVTILPASIDFLTPTTVDVTDGHVSQIGPYDAARASRVKSFRRFEARGKFLVVVDASQPGWLGRVQAGGARQIDIGTAGDFLVVDVDPRMQSVSRTQIAAAVIGGQYLSREDALATLK